MTWKNTKFTEHFCFGGVSYYDIEQIPTLALKTTLIQMENLQLFTFILIMKTRFPWHASPCIFAANEVIAEVTKARKSFCI